MEEGNTDEVALTDQELIAPEVVVDEAEADAGLVPVTDVELLVPEPHTSEELVREEVPTVTEVEETDVTETSSNSETMEQSAITTEASNEASADEKEAEQQLESFEPILDTSAIEVDQDSSVTEVDKPVQSEVKKPVGPPVNVVMTTKDLMAMYRARREQNNLHGKK